MGRRPGPVRPLDGGWGWMTVLGCGLAHFLLTGVSRAFGVFYVALLDRFHESEGATALICSIFNILRSGFGPMASVLSEQFTSRRVVIVGGLFMCTGCVISAFASSVVYMYLSFGLVTGIGAGLAFTPSLIVVSQYFDKKKGKAMAFSTLGSGIGAFTLAPLFTALLQQYTYPGAMLLLGSLVLHCSVAGSLYRPLADNFSKHFVLGEVEIKEEIGNCERNERNGVEVARDVAVPLHELSAKKLLSGSSNKRTGNVSVTNQTNTGRVGKILTSNKAAVAPLSNGASDISNMKIKRKRTEKVKAYFSILKQPVFFCYGLVIFGMPVCTATSLVLLPALGRFQGYSKTQAAMLVSMAGISDCVGRFIAGFFFDFEFVRRHRLHYHIVFALLAGSFASVLPLMPTYVTLSCAVCFYSSFMSAFHSQRMTVLTDFMPRRQVTQAVGWIHLFQGMGDTGPVIGGYLKDLYGSYTASYLFAGGTIVLFGTVHWIVLFIYDFAKYKKARSTISSGLI